MESSTEVDEDVFARPRTRSFSVFNVISAGAQGQNGGTPTWKFWRRFSFRSRGRDSRSKVKNYSDFGQLTKSDIGEPLDLAEPSSPPVHGSRGLPDVLERAHALPLFNANAVPPPKPPRLFLGRSQSTGPGSRSSSAESVVDNKAKSISLGDADPSQDAADRAYANCQRVKTTRSQLPDTGDYVETLSSQPAGENNNVVGKYNPLSFVSEEVCEELIQALQNTDLLTSSSIPTPTIVNSSSPLTLESLTTSADTPKINADDGYYSTLTIDHDSSTSTTNNNDTTTTTTVMAATAPPPVPTSPPPQPPQQPSLTSATSATSTTSSSSPRIGRAATAATPNPYQQYHSSTVPRKPKIVTPELSHKRHARSRRRSSTDRNGGHVSRQRHIMNSLMDLMGQRLDPYPLLDPLKRAGVLTNVHLQSFLGHRDRKSVCENLADVIAKGGPETMSVFCAVMASGPSGCTEILEVLQVMREFDRIIHDIPKHARPSDDVSKNDADGGDAADNSNSFSLDADTTATAATAMADESHLNFDIGFMGTDYSLKPLVELDRVRANAGTDSGSGGSGGSSNGGGGSNGGGNRLSNASFKTSSYSLLEIGGGGSGGGGGGYGGSVATLGPAAGHGGGCGGGFGGGGGVGVMNHPMGGITILPGLIMMSISVTGHSLAGERSEALAEVIRNHNCISELHLGKTDLSGQDVTRLTDALADKGSTVHSLDLRLNAIDAQGAQAVTQLVRHTRFLRCLNISSTELDSQSFRQLVSAVSANKTLVELDASFLDLTDDCCPALRDMLRANSTLHKLRLRGNNLTCAGCQTLCEGLARNIGLSSLDLSRNPIGDAGIKALAQYMPDSQVTDVSVDGCGISLHGCQSLTELVSDCKKLKHLDVSTNSLEDAGIARLAPALERSSSLEAVSMNMCSISNDGFHKLLDVLEKNASIQGLKLCFNKLGGQHSNPAATSDNLRYRLRIVMSSKPKLKILLWGNEFDESS